MRLGYKLMSEETGPRELVINAARAEEAGFDFAAISDHFLPWAEAQGHAPFIWSVLGSIASLTEQIGLMTAVTCPSFRYHPAIVAQAAATVSLLAGSRFRLGLGSGERLNEHVVGGGWPSVSVRQKRLEEAIDIIRMLLEGGICSYRGLHFELERARLFDLPDERPRILVAAGGPHAARIAATRGDGLMATQPRRELVEAYTGAGGDGPRCVEISLCWAESTEAAVATMLRYARWSPLDWRVLPELETPDSFDAASRSVRPNDLTDIAHGPEVGRYLGAIGPYLEAGYDELVLHQIGPEQEGFLRFFEHELAPALRRHAPDAERHRMRA
jgi:G6PDH family F420-dependent oxidoreductase